jgi:hypothetical protein
MRLVDNIENKSYKSSKIVIRMLLKNLYDTYKKEGLLTGVIKIKDTWYIG